MQSAITNKSTEIRGKAKRTNGRNAGQSFDILHNWALADGDDTATGRVYQYVKEDGTHVIVGVAHSADRMPGIPYLTADKSTLQVADGEVTVGPRFTYDGALATVETPSPIKSSKRRGRRASATPADTADAVGLTEADVARIAESLAKILKS